MNHRTLGRPGRLGPALAMALAGLIAAALPGAAADRGGAAGPDWNGNWPVLRTYDHDHLARLVLPLGGIGTGTVGLRGRGQLCDWEIMNRPAKGFTPWAWQQTGPFFAIYAAAEGQDPVCRALEGPLPLDVYEASHGSTAVNHGLPRFRECAFAAAYPFGQVYLSDPAMPVEVRLEAFSPLVPGDADASGYPGAVLRYVILNRTARPLRAVVCGTLPNFIGVDGSETARDWKNDPQARGANKNRNEFRTANGLRGLFMSSTGVDPKDEAWGTIALVTTCPEGTSRTAWLEEGWGTSLLDFWDDFSTDGRLEERASSGADMPFGSLTAEAEVPASGRSEVTFLVAWHFPNRRTWTPKNTAEDIIGNYYTTRWKDAWDAVEDLAAGRDSLERQTCEFVRALASSTLPDEVKEAALFNLSTLRTQTCFRTPDGRFFGFEGSSNGSGCCYGSCTHVWNYEQATAFLFGELARSMRETEFADATDESGLMSFRVGLPLAGRARDFGKAAADGQMGCIMKMYREWKLSGDDAWLKSLWPKVRKALAFAWIPGGWDADQDGVMEGCQHNTMDVEYFGPNPQMELWYLGALRAAEEMARRMGDKTFGATCRTLFEEGRSWTDAHLFNGEYYEQDIRPPRSEADVAPSLRVGMGARDMTQPGYQLGRACLVDQLVGQFMAHVCGLGYLVDEGHVKTTLRSIFAHNLRRGFDDHFNCMRSFALGDEAGLLMASYPKGRPANPFPYFTEVMTGFEYTAAVGMLYEGDVEAGIQCIRNIRARYDGRKRSPFDEAECGHHYARAMASWAAVLALSGFQYSGLDQTMTMAAREGMFFWSNGSAWGTCRISRTGAACAPLEDDFPGESGDETQAPKAVGGLEASGERRPSLCGSLPEAPGGCEGPSVCDGGGTRDAYGRVGFAGPGGGFSVELTVLHGELDLRGFRLGATPLFASRTPRSIRAGETLNLGSDQVK